MNLSTEWVDARVNSTLGCDHSNKANNNDNVLINRNLTLIYLLTKIVSFFSRSLFFFFVVQFIIYLTFLKNLKKKKKQHKICSCSQNQLKKCLTCLLVVTCATDSWSAFYFSKLEFCYSNQIQTAPGISDYL